VFDRRVHPRFVLSGPLKATFRLIEDVTVERVTDDELWVLSGVPARPDERLMVDRVGSAPPMVLGMRVIGSDPVLVGNVLQHRVRLAFGASNNGAEQAGIRGSLVRRVSVEVLEVSRGGCLLQAAMAIEAGTFGELQVMSDDAECRDPVRIARCVRVEGAGSAFRLGAAFLHAQAGDAHYGVALGSSEGERGGNGRVRT